MTRSDRGAISQHFSTVAARYNDLRTTDPEPVDLMARSLAGLSVVTAADVGCGTGRYMIELMRRLGEKPFVYFIDCSKGMLEQLRVDLDMLDISGFDILHSRAESLPLPDGSLGCMFTFNAIHHFDLIRFFREAGRTLRPGGLLFIYTRFRDQNERGIWGQYFPDFAEKEKRLYDEEHVNRTIGSAEGLVVRDLTHFSFRRAASLHYLIYQARSSHYSTFCFYEPDELERAIEGFEANLKETLGALDALEWVDENVMITVERV
ncbi:MAG: class I SAM-dependent methyltransferase [Thermoleophilia bacterium]|nr:class I SAM-dependent methyltransferase [Thermoleophilia bacterium]